jgi:uncharacterized repeat protein (TIGR03803 family)
MVSLNFRRTAFGRTALGLVFLCVTSHAIASLAVGSEQLIFSFDGYAGGSSPIDRAIFDSKGNIYGVTQVGGAYNAGIVFELTPSSDGTWTETVLHNFGGADDGVYPSGGLTFDSAGNLYGTTQIGGTQTCLHGQCGTVFELSPQGNGEWTETVLYTFDYYHGAISLGGVIFDAAQNIYGVASGGGSSDAGTVFELKKVSGAWNIAVLHEFNGSDGFSPVGGLTQDREGNLWGVTSLGGTSNDGTVFEIVRSSGSWAFQSIYSFQGGSDGNSPSGRLTLDKAGNWFGLTVIGGTGKCENEGCGTAFELTGSGTSWTESIIHSFQGRDGALPELASLAIDANGTLYGETTFGGNGNCDDDGLKGCGVIFKLAASNGGWTEEVIHEFPGSGEDGIYPEGALTLNQQIYGLSTEGGTSVAGAAYEITP